MMGIFNKKDKQLLDVPPFPSAPAPGVDLPEEEEWVWVDGYKGTDKNMQCKNNFQYELGKAYTCEGDIVECENGFHLCANLRDTFYYYDIADNPSNRYFKVKALVRPKDVESYGKVSLFNGALDMRTKLVARQIILTEEVSEKELFNATTGLYDQFIKHFDDFEAFRSQELPLMIWFKNKCKNNLHRKYSDTFIEIMFNNNNWYNSYKLALALYDEGVSADMRAYLILEELKR